MTIITFETTTYQSLERANLLLGHLDKGAVRAAWSAMKRAGESAKTEAGRFAAETYTITKGTFMKNVTTKTHMEGSDTEVQSLYITFSGNVIELSYFNTRVSKDGRVTTQVMRNGGATTLQHAFEARISGRENIYERVGSSRFPVEGKWGPSAAHMMNNDEVIEKMTDKIDKVYEDRIEHEILRVMNGWGVK